MIYKITSISCYLVLLFIKLLVAQELPNTSSNQGSSPSSLQPRFSDPGAMGFPNFGSGRFGNPTSNYPTNSFFPFGNQNNNMQRPQQGPGLGYNPNQGNFQNRPIQRYPNQPDYPNQQGYPYQGDSMNPNPNFQRPHYSNQNIQNRPIQGGFPNQNDYPYQGDNSIQYPNYQRPSYPNRPDDGSLMYPDDISNPYQNGRPVPGPISPGQSFQYPPQGNRYPPQGNFQGNGNPNLRPDQMNPNGRPDDLGNLPDSNIHFPDGLYQHQPNQYYPQTRPNQNLRPGSVPNGNFQNYPFNNNPNTNIQFLTNNQLGDPSAIQYPNQSLNPVGSGNVVPGPSVNPGNFNNVFQNQPQLPNNQENIPSYNDTAAILGKPVIVPPTTSSPAQAVLDNSTAEAASRKKCVQDCPTTSEYAPVCGTNNVTYINPGKFDCALKCGEAVYLKQRGRCPEDIAPNNLEQ